MPETCRNLDQIDRRTLLAGGSLLVAAGLAAKLGSFGWTGTPGLGTFTIGSPDALAPGEHADLVLHGDRLERLAQLRGVLRNARPGSVSLKLDAADDVMLDLAMAEQGIHASAAQAPTITLTYRKGAKA